MKLTKTCNDAKQRLNLRSYSYPSPLTFIGTLNSIIPIRLYVHLHKQIAIHDSEYTTPLRRATIKAWEVTYASILWLSRLRKVSQKILDFNQLGNERAVSYDMPYILIIFPTRHQRKKGGENNKMEYRPFQKNHLSVVTTELLVSRGCKIFSDETTSLLLYR